MAHLFDAANAPFDRLSPPEVDVVRSALDIGYFRAGETVIAEGATPESYFVVIKGCVEEREGSEVVSLREPGDAFDSRAFAPGGRANAFVAREETLCHLLPRDVTLRLIDHNRRFAAYFHHDISCKLEAAVGEADAARFSPLMRARVRDVVTRKAEFVEASDSIERTARRMSEIDAKALLVRAGDHVGIVTKTDLADAVILRKIPIAAAVGPIAQYRVVSVDADDFVSMALLLMTKHCKRRVAVTREGVYVGILEDVDLMSFLAGASQLVAARIDRAAGKDDLGLAAREIEGQTRILRRQGVRIEIVCEIVSDLNRRLFAKLFEILAPESIARKACLIVMGSEGRGEQSLRTDQDNGLILSEPIPETELAAFRMAFTAGLERFGFPPCPGDVMVRNPHWSKSLDDYRGDFRRWIALGDEAADMNIAIVYDAVAVAGDPELLAELKRDLIEAMSGEPLRLARFARAADAFPQPIGFFANWSSPKGQLDALDLKKSGIFPIVHGARSLAIEHRLTETGTAARIARLAEKGALTEDFARELIQALRYLMTLRLDGQIATAYAGDLAPRAALSSMDRDLLRDAFQIVKRFREMLRRHFHLNMF